MAVIEGARRAATVAGVPSVGTTAVQTLATTGTPTGGTFKLIFEGFITAALAHNSAAATVVTALEALPSIGTGGVTATGGALPTGVVITFAANKIAMLVPLIALYSNAMTGGTTPTATITNTTPGVLSTAKGLPKGSQISDVTNGKLYINTGTALLPVWTVVGSQT